MPVSRWEYDLQHEMQPEAPLYSSDTSTPIQRGNGWPRLISDILSPPVIWAVVAFPVAFKGADTPAQALLWALIYGVIVCLLPALYILSLAARGHITDIHMAVRTQRIRPFIVSIICTMLAWWVLRLLGAPPLLPMFTLFSLIQIAIMLAITLVWQISMHTMSITGAVVIFGALYGPLVGLLLLPLIAVVGAARIKLNRHTPAQVVAGGLVGGVATFCMFLISRGV